MGVEVNKFGVPYHAYELTLDDGHIVNFDMAWEEYWGDVSEWYADCKNELPGWNGYIGEAYVGYGNEVDGYRRIWRVWDCESCRYVNPLEFLKECKRWVLAYSS